MTILKRLYIIGKKQKETIVKKKVGFGILIFIEIACIVGIYLVGGQVGPWLWSICVFIIAPVASIVLVIQVIIDNPVKMKFPICSEGLPMGVKK